MNRERTGELKENYRESSGHISFHNPNYAGGGNGGNDSRPNRFQGIFKYDKNQVSLVREIGIICFFFIRTLPKQSIVSKLLYLRAQSRIKLYKQ